MNCKCNKNRINAKIISPIYSADFTREVFVSFGNCDSVMYWLKLKLLLHLVQIGIGIMHFVVDLFNKLTRCLMLNLQLLNLSLVVHFSVHVEGCTWVKSDTCDTATQPFLSSDILTQSLLKRDRHFEKKYCYFVTHDLLEIIKEWHSTFGDTTLYIY